MNSMSIPAYCLIAAAFVALNISTPANANPQRAQAQANFQAADANKNEQLDMTEFTTFINLNADSNLGQASTIRRFGMYEKAFTSADGNGDGNVSKDEIAAQAK